jgi:hypothetical protein
MAQTDSPWRPRPRRLGLYAPFALLAIAIIALSASWFRARGRVAAALEAARTPRAGSPVTLSFAARRISGYPFRLDLDLDGARLTDPSGWSLAAPKVKAEAYLFAPGHWVIVAPDGVTVGRRRDGPLVVRAKALRASLSDPGRRPPRLSVEGLDLTFATPAGAKPFLLSAAKAFHFHAKAGPDDQGAAYLEIDQADARPEGLLGRVAAGRPVGLVADGIYSHADALAGDDWPQALRDWTQAGGALELRRLRLTAGDALIEAKAGTLTAGGDGRLQGALDLTVRQAAGVVGAMGGLGALSPDAARAALAVAAVRGAPAASLTLHFEAGRTTLGPVALGPAPRLF